MSKYEPLRRHLEGASVDRYRASFEEVEGILGFTLPKSARRYREWWANDRHGHTQAQAWLRAGWEASEVDMSGQRVTFVRMARLRSEHGRGIAAMIS